jgi:hypothetical protein
VATPYIVRDTGKCGECFKHLKECRDCGKDFPVSEMGTNQRCTSCISLTKLRKKTGKTDTKRVIELETENITLKERLSALEARMSKVESDVSIHHRLLRPFVNAYAEYLRVNKTLVESGYGENIVHDDIGQAIFHIDGTSIHLTKMFDPKDFPEIMKYFPDELHDY